MASVFLVTPTASTANASSYVSNAFTPVADDQLCVMVAVTGSITAAPTLTSSQGLTFTLDSTVTYNAGTDRIYVFYSNERCTAIAQTVTFDCTPDAGTGCFIAIWRVAGAYMFGQSKAAAGTAGTTPALTLDAAYVSTDPIMALIANGSSPNGVTVPTGWASDSSAVVIATPTAGILGTHKTTGGSTTVTAGSTSATAWGMVVAEITRDVLLASDITVSAVVTAAFQGPLSTLAGTLKTVVSPVAGLANSRNLAWFYKPEVANDYAEMAKYDVMILTRGDEAAITAVRAAGYKGTILQYVRADAIQNTAGTPAKNQVAWNVGDWDDIINNHPTWFLYDNAGNLCPGLTGSNYFMMDWANVEWQQFFIDRVNAYQATSAFDGIFMDNIEASLAKRAGEGQILRDYTTDAQYQAAVKKFLAAVYAGINTKPVSAGNVINLRPETAWPEYLAYLDGAMNEASFVDWHTGYLSVTGWLNDLALAIPGKQIIFVSQSDSSTDTARQRFCFASYLLIHNPNTSFRFISTTVYNQSWWYPNYDYALGNPVAAYFVSGSDYIRFYDYGKITVNPTTHAATIEVFSPISAGINTTVVVTAALQTTVGAINLAADITTSGVAGADLDTSITMAGNLATAVVVNVTLVPGTPIVVAPFTNYYEFALMASSKLRSVLLDVASLAIEISQLPPRNSAAVVWTAVGGSYANLVKINLVSGGTKSIVIDDVPRKMTKFTVGHKTGRVVYAAVASKTVANATPKSWYYDFPNRDLYVYPEAGVDLSTRICFAWILYHVSNYPKTLGGNFYEPRLLSDSSAFEQEVAVGDKFFTAQPATGGGLNYINADGFYDRLLSDYEWRAGRHSLSHGIDTINVDMDLADYEPVRNAMVESVTRTDERVSLEFMALAKRLDVPIHRLHYDSVTDSGDNPKQVAYANMDGEREGQDQPVVYGDGDKTGSAEANFKKAMQVTVVDKGQKQATGDGWLGRKVKAGAVVEDPETGASHGFENITKVYLLRAGSYSIVSTNQYSLSDGNTLITFPNFALYDTDEIRVMAKAIRDVAGKFTGGAGTGSIKLAWDAIMHALIVFAGLTVDEVNVPSMTAVGTTKTINGVAYAGTLVPPAWNDNIRVRMHGKDGGTVQELVDLLNRSMRSFLYEDTSGRATLGFLDTEISETDLILTDEDIADFSEKLGVENMVPRVVVEYDYHPSSEFHRKAKSDPTTNGVTNNYAGALFGFEKTGKTKRHHKFGGDGGAAVENVTTALSTRAQAKLLANRYFDTWVRDQVYYKLTDVIGRALGLHEGSKLILRRLRAIGGAVNRKVLWLRKGGKNWTSSVMTIGEAVEAF